MVIAVLVAVLLLLGKPIHLDEIDRTTMARQVLAIAAFAILQASLFVFATVGGRLLFRIKHHPQQQHQQQQHRGYSCWGMTGLALLLISLGLCVRILVIRNNSIQDDEWPCGGRWPDPEACQEDRLDALCLYVAVISELFAAGIILMVVLCSSSSSCGKEEEEDELPLAKDENGPSIPTTMEDVFSEDVPAIDATTEGIGRREDTETSSMRTPLLETRPLLQSV